MPPSLHCGGGGLQTRRAKAVLALGGGHVAGAGRWAPERGCREVGWALGVCGLVSVSLASRRPPLPIACSIPAHYREEVGRGGGVTTPFSQPQL